MVMASVNLLLHHPVCINLHDFLAKQNCLIRMKANTIVSLTEAFFQQIMISNMTNASLFDSPPNLVRKIKKHFFWTVFWGGGGGWGAVHGFYAI